MTLDTIDQAFVARWKARRLSAEPCPPLAECEPDATVATTPKPEPAAPIEPPEVASVPADVVAIEPSPTKAPLLERLLATGRDQWESLADEVEAARLTGLRVIAIAGGEQGEGRTTLVACLAQVLDDRGRDVVTFASGAQAQQVADGPPDGGQLNDRRIVLVDAGVWFPPGLIRRERLGVVSAGCDAAILVRRADRESVPSRVAALAAVGATVLGEVVTFAPPSGDA